MRVFTMQDRVAFFETDAGGIIHFMFALRYFEMGEREAMRQIGVKIGDSRRGGQEFPRVHLSCDYHQRLYYDDPIVIHTTCVNIGNSSILWGIKVYRCEQLCISGQMKVVAVDNSGKPMRVPNEWRAALLEGERIDDC